jgi:hypothetical protein
MTFRNILLSLLPGAAFAVASSGASAATSQGGEIPDALVITKSSNKNQVNYAVRVDDSCAPVSGSSVRPYWRMLERGRDATEPLRSDELRAFGIVRQDADANGVNLLIRGLPARSIRIRTWRAADGTCAASASTTIAGVPARVANVHVQQKLFGVDYVLLTGWAADGGTIVHERLSP